MSKLKRINISITKETHEKAREQSVLVLGQENISGYFSYLINKEHKELK